MLTVCPTTDKRPPALLPLVLKSLFFHSFQLFVSLPGAAAVNLARPHSPEPPPLTVGGSSHSSSTVLSLPPVASTPALPTLSPSVKQNQPLLGNSLEKISQTDGLMQLMQGKVHDDRIPKEATTTTTHRTADKLLCKSQNSKN